MKKITLFIIPGLLLIMGASCTMPQASNLHNKYYVKKVDISQYLQTELDGSQQYTNILSGLSLKVPGDWKYTENPKQSQPIATFYKEDPQHGLYEGEYAGMYPNQLHFTATVIQKDDQDFERQLNIAHGTWKPDLFGSEQALSHEPITLSSMNGHRYRISYTLTEGGVQKGYVRSVFAFIVDENTLVAASAVVGRGSEYDASTQAIQTVIESLTVTLPKEGDQRLVSYQYHNNQYIFDLLRHIGLSLPEEFSPLWTVTESGNNEKSSTILFLKKEVTTKRHEATEAPVVFPAATMQVLLYNKTDQSKEFQESANALNNGIEKQIIAGTIDLIPKPTTVYKEYENDTNGMKTVTLVGDYDIGSKKYSRSDTFIQRNSNYILHVIKMNESINGQGLDEAYFPALAQ